MSSRSICYLTLVLLASGGCDQSPTVLDHSFSADALTATTVRADAALPLGLVAWWSGNRHARDPIGRNHGELYGDAGFAPGLVGHAFSFGGAGGHVHVPNSPRLNPTTAATVVFWVRPDPANPMDGCCQGLVMTDFYGSEIAGFEAGGSAIMFAGTDLSWAHSSDLMGRGFPLSPGRWDHLAGVYDGASVRLYANGVLFQESPATGTILPMLEETDFGPSFLTIGSEDGRKNEPGLTGQRYFHGLIDEVRIYDRALEDAEIGHLHRMHSALAAVKNRGSR